MRVVVHPREEAYQEEEKRDGEELAERLVRMFEHLPRVQDFHYQTGQQAELGTSGTDLEPKQTGIITLNLYFWTWLIALRKSV